MPLKYQNHFPNLTSSMSGFMNGRRTSSLGAYINGQEENELGQMTGTPSSEKIKEVLSVKA